MQKTILPNQKEIRIKAQEFDSDRIAFSKGKPYAPVDIEYILEARYSFELAFVAGLESDYQKSAIIASDFKTMYIDLNQYSNPIYYNRVRFSLAHELAHKMLHESIFKKFVTDVSIEEVKRFHIEGLDEKTIFQIERQADEFAGQILVPRKSLIFESAMLLRENLDVIYDNNVSFENMLKALSPKLAKKYKVTDTVIEIRMRKENVCESVSLDPHSPISQLSKKEIDLLLGKVSNENRRFTTSF